MRQARAGLLLFIGVACLLRPSPCLAQTRQRPALTPEQGRYLLDRAEAKRWQLVPTPARSDRGGESDERGEALPPELMQLQQALGGSVVDQYGGLRNLPEEPDGPRRPATTAGGRRQAAIEALRDAAWQLDASAHRLEALDLYRQADALRDQARQLRLDARSMIDRGQPHALPPTDAHSAAPQLPPTSPGPVEEPRPLTASPAPDPLDPPDESAPSEPQPLGSPPAPDLAEPETPSAAEAEGTSGRFGR